MILTDEHNCGNCHYYWLRNSKDECAGRDLPQDSDCEKYKKEKKKDAERRALKELIEFKKNYHEPDYPKDGGESYLSKRWHAEH